MSKISMFFLLSVSVSVLLSIPLTQNANAVTDDFFKIYKDWAKKTIKIWKDRVNELEDKIIQLTEKNKEQEKTINDLKQKLISLEQKQETKTIKYTVYENVISNDFLNLAFTKWIDVNPQLNFINSNETSSLKIKPLPKFLDSSNRYMVHLGTYSEDTNTIYLDSALNPTLKIETLSHEFGHYLGLGHSCQENSIYGLMYGKTNCVEDKSYNTLGYNIPSPQCVEISGQIKCR